MDRSLNMDSARTISTNRQSYFDSVKKNYKRNKWVYYMALPVILYYIVFKYIPMFGITIAFQDYSPAKGFLNSEWVGFGQFRKFFKSPFAPRVIKNTVMLNLYGLLWGFPAPILFALLLNEIGINRYKKTIQTVSYMPHFISLVVVCGLLKEFSLSNGLFNDVGHLFGMERENLLSNANYFRAIYVASDIWQGMGWGSIIYLATIAGADPNLYEAAVIDGAGRLRQAIHITFPTILPVVVIQLIMRIGRMMSMGSEKVILLYSPLVYEKADIISSYVYRVGLQDMQYSFGAAVGLFNSVVNLALLVFANKFADKVLEESLW